MSKKITILEGNETRTFTGVNKIHTNKVGGGTVSWIPEDEADKYANVGTLYASENGEYSASSDGYVGYSNVSVNVPTGGGDGGGGGGGGGTLISKNITANGTYTASSDGADGYSKVTVNVSYPHGQMLLKGVNHAPASQRISTRNFIEDFNEKLFNHLYSYATEKELSAEWKLRLEGEVRYGGWLKTFGVTRLLNYDNLVLIASGGSAAGYNPASINIRLAVCGIYSEEAVITIVDETEETIEGEFDTHWSMAAYWENCIYGYARANYREIKSYGYDHIDNDYDNYGIFDLLNKIDAGSPLSNKQLTSTYVANFPEVRQASMREGYVTMTNLTGGTVVE